ncbi:MAG: glycosyltransferase, partial [Gemmatimonadales bacterium]|nr:glycosyltransferase [Gemmatimonadales bacterium]
DLRLTPLAAVMSGLVLGIGAVILVYCAGYFTGVSNTRKLPTFAAELAMPEGAQVVGVVASLSPIKDHATLLTAVALLARTHPNVHLILVGADAGSRADLEAQSAALGIDARTRFAGLRPSQPSPHHVFDISVLSSRSEGLPNSILEAMAAARPVVATAVGAVADAVVHEETGLLVPPGDPPAMAAALARLLDAPELGAAFGHAGRARARDRYSAAAAMGRLVDLYRTMARD